MRKDIQDGKLTMLTHEFKFSDTDFKQLETLLTKYVTALKDNINSRFEDALSVLKAFDIFNPVSLPERTAAEFIDYGVTSLEKLKFANQCQLPMLGLKGVRAPLKGSKLDLEVPLSKT